MQELVCGGGYWTFNQKRHNQFYFQKYIRRLKRVILKQQRVYFSLNTLNAFLLIKCKCILAGFYQCKFSFKRFFNYFFLY